MPDEPTQPQASPALSEAQKRAQEARAQRIADAAKLAAKRDELKKNVGQSFTDGERVANVTGFEPRQNVKGAVADAFLVNFGNPNCHQFIHCEQFLDEFQPAKGVV